jgi:hypothetical protein
MERFFCDYYARAGTDSESNNGFDAFAIQRFFNRPIDVLEGIEGDELFQWKTAKRMKLY